MKKPALQKKTCPVCGTKFRPLNGTHRFCSQACRMSVTVEDAPCVDEGPRRCLYCGRTFTARTGQGWQCSKKCCESTLVLHTKIRAKQAKR